MLFNNYSNLIYNQKQVLLTTLTTKAEICDILKHVLKIPN